LAVFGFDAYQFGGLAQFAEKQEIVKRALVHAMKPGLVAVEEVQVGASGQIGEGGGDAIQFIGLGTFPDAVIEQARFDGPETAKTPDAGHHFLDGAFLDIVGWRELGKMLREESGESLLRFVLKHYSFGQKAVTYSVEGRPALALFGSRSA